MDGLGRHDDDVPGADRLLALADGEGCGPGLDDEGLRIRMQVQVRALPTLVPGDEESRPRSDPPPSNSAAVALRLNSASGITVANASSSPIEPILIHALRSP